MGIDNLRNIFFITALLSSMSLIAQSNQEIPDSTLIVTNSFKDNWYGQIGVDMDLLIPYEHNIKNVFPNGKSLGVNMAIGKWFSPELGTRFKVSWNNGIIKENHNIWYYPYGEPGGSYHEGGYLTFVGDIQFNLHNLFDEYQVDRKWNAIAAVRAGGWLNAGTGKGCPLLGVGFVNTYRLNDHWSIYADLGWHFVASINEVQSGEGHGSNGYAELNIGVEMDLGHRKFQKALDKPVRNPKGAIVNSFWDNWFVQAGVGMSLLNPYNTNFANVFPNGKTLGINLNIGKWFTPEAGVRGGINWQNGIVGNKHAYYLDSKDGQKLNYKEHGFISLYADLFLNLTHIIKGYDESRTWNAIVYPRMGLVNNFSSSYQECPLLGIGTEQQFRINRNLSVYADFVYHVTTSGFLDRKFLTRKVGLHHNGWFDLNVGIQYELGKSKGRWKKIN